MKQKNTVEVKQNMEPHQFSDNLGREVTFTERMGSSQRGSGGKQNATLFIGGSIRNRKIPEAGKTFHHSFCRRTATRAACQERSYKRGYVKKSQ